MVPAGWQTENQVVAEVMLDETGVVQGTAGIHHTSNHLRGGNQFVDLALLIYGLHLRIVGRTCIPCKNPMESDPACEACEHYKCDPDANAGVTEAPMLQDGKRPLFAMR